MLKRLLRTTRSFFNFSHSEARGFLLLSFLMAVFAIFFLVYDQIPSDGYTTYQEDKALLDSLMAQIENSSPGSEGAVDLPEEAAAVIKEMHRFQFNPNLLPVDSLALLGIPPALAQRIENYRKKGGRFRKKEDLLKIYGFPEGLYQSIQAYIKIPVAVQQKEIFTAIPSADKGSRKEKTETLASFDINQADSLQLLKVNGIGPVLSSRILKFRNKLGGFVHMEQLYEVYGLDSMVVKKLMEKAFVKEGFQPEPIFLNSASEEELATHPYLNYEQARVIFRYRTEHGAFTKLSDLQKIHTLAPELIDKIAPYIRFE